MNKFLVVERGSRGFIEDVEIKESNLSIEDFCNKLYSDKLEELKEEGVVEDGEDLEEYLGEFGGVSNEGDFWEVGWSEEDWYEVYKICV
jgi:hypothetical protein